MCYKFVSFGLLCAVAMNRNSLFPCWRFELANIQFHFLLKIPNLRNLWLPYMYEWYGCICKSLEYPWAVIRDLKSMVRILAKEAYYFF
jgi:hypothetical protein